MSVNPPPPPDSSRVGDVSSSGSVTNQDVINNCKQLVTNLTQFYHFFNPENTSSNSFEGQLIALENAVLNNPPGSTAITTAVTNLKNSMTKYFGSSSSLGVLGKAAQALRNLNSIFLHHPSDQSLYQNLPYGFNFQSVANIATLFDQGLDSSTHILFTPMSNDPDHSSFPGDFVYDVNQQLQDVQNATSRSSSTIALGDLMGVIEKAQDISKEPKGVLGIWLQHSKICIKGGEGIKQIIPDPPPPPTS